MLCVDYIPKIYALGIEMKDKFGGFLFYFVHFDALLE